MKKACFFYRCGAIALYGVFLTLFANDAAFAVSASGVDTIAKNVTTSAEDLPGLLTATSYLLALLLGVTGILKLKDHVENPSQTPLRTPLIRFIIGGALVALPIVYSAMTTTFSGGGPMPGDHQGNMSSDMGHMTGLSISALNLVSFDAILKNIANSFDEVPGAIAAGSYLFGLLMGVAGLLKLKDHVENPERTELKEGVIRLLTGGALFALPTICEAAFMTINSSGLTTGDGALSVLGARALASALGIGAIENVSQYAGALSNCTSGSPLAPFGLGSDTLGNVLCSIQLNSASFPLFLNLIGYLIGLVMIIWGIIKIKAHVLNPSQTGLSEGITRFLAGGCFFALPAMISVAMETFRNVGLYGAALVPAPHGYNDGASGGWAAMIPFWPSGGSACDGLDGMINCFMTDVLGPMNGLINFFAFCAGVVLIMIGISRLIKSAQEGARGPLGLGTFMTFAAGGALCSYNELIRAVTGTLFVTPITATYGELQYTTGMDPDAVAHANAVVAAIIKFMILVGLVSFVRGIFIIREASEGSQQSSLMSGITHIVGGALAVNLGPLINAVESTLGMSAYGIQFS